MCITTTNTKKIRGVLFDLDGTLLNTLDDLAGAMNIVLKRHNREVHPVGDYKYFVGDGVSQLVKRALNEQSADSALLSGLQEEFLQEYELSSTNITAPYPGVTEILEELQIRQVPMTVVSNKPHELTVGTVRNYFSAISFVAIIGDGVFVRKPDPASALYCASVMGIAPAECLFVGDTGTDMATAKAARMPAAGALWGFRDKKELYEAGAQWVIEHPREINDIIDNFK